MKTRRARGLLGATLCVSAFAGSTGELVPSSAPPEFPYKAGWLGGDAGFSIPLGHSRILWLFGDTFTGAPNAKTRTAKTAMPRNSIGIWRCTAGPCQMQYFWRGMYTPHPRAFFDLPADHWFWPLDGFVDHGTLYIVLEEMRSDGTGAFGFAYSGVTLASITNPDDPPALWKIRYQEIMKGEKVIPGVSAVAGRSEFNPYPKDPDGAAWVYFFTLQVLSSDKSFLALTRFPIARLNEAEQAAGHWQYLSTRNVWTRWTTPGRLPNDVKMVIDAGYTEFTARFHPERREWLTIAPGKAFTESRAVYRTAPAIDGPWSGPQTLIEYPEMKKTDSDYTPHVFCYAAKEHPEYQQPGSLVLTYACNSLKEPELFRNIKLYHPVVVRRPTP